MRSQPYRPHYHPCVNKSLGCTWSLTCNGLPDRDDAEAVCTDAVRFHLDRWQCDECEESTCAECGEVIRLGPHDRSCTQHPEYDPTPWEIGDTTGDRTDAAHRMEEARQIKR